MIGRISDIDLRLLRAFAAVVEAGGFSLATARLNVAESTISSHMSDLETRLGVRLCERGRGGFRLTRAGEQLYETIGELLDDLDRYRDRIAEVSTRVGSALRLGLPDAIVTNDALPVADWVAAFMERFPEIRVEVRMFDPRGLERAVMNDRLHAAIVPIHRPVAGLIYQPIGEEVNCLYCGAAHSLFERADSGIGKEDLEAGGLISRGYIDNFDADFFDAAAHQATVSEIESAAVLVLSGRFIGFLPEHFARSYVEAGAMRPLKPQEIRLEVPFALAYKKGLEQDIRIDALLAICRQEDHLS